MKAGSDLERVLSAGRFAVTAEIGPPKSASPETIIKHARDMRGNADAFNLTDNQTAMVRLSSIASGVICLQEGLEPVMQMTCRDRNRIAMQSDILGASALGIRNVLCISGDHQCFGNQKEAKNVYDLDSIQELMVFARCGTRAGVGRGQAGGAAQAVPRGGGQPVRRPVRVPGAPPGQEGQRRGGLHPDPVHLRHGTVRALDGAGARARVCTRRVHILAGVMPLKSHKVALYMKNKVSGMIVPDEVVDRMRAAKDPKAEGAPAVRGADRASQEHRGRPRRAHHGRGLGGEGPGDRAGCRAPAPTRSGPVRRKGLVGMAIIILVSMLVAGLVLRHHGREGNITSNDDFFTTSINGEPVIDVENWTLTVNGTVGNELVLDYQDVLDLEKVTALATQRCVTGPSDTASWTGVKVSELLQMAGPDPEAKEVVFVCADGYTTSLTLDEIEESGAWLAYGMNEEVLPVQHGFPLRLVVPDFWGYKWAKWVVALVVIDYDYQGYWEDRGWSDDAASAPTPTGPCTRPY